MLLRRRSSSTIVQILAAISHDLREIERPVQDGIAYDYQDTGKAAAVSGRVEGIALHQAAWAAAQRLLDGGVSWPL